MAGRRPAGTRSGAPLWREEDDPHGRQEPARASEPAADRPVAARPSAGRSDRSVPGQRAPRGAGAGRGAARTGSDAQAAKRMPAVLPALGLPVLGALADELLGPGLGLPYALCAVLGAGLAALVSSRAGWWWVVSGAPVVTLGVAGAVDYLGRGDAYRGAGLATQGAQLISGQFLPMLAALAVTLLAVAVRVRRTRRAPRAPRGPGAPRTARTARTARTRRPAEHG